jgi:selenocysteine-specific elongation factor
MDKLLVAFNKIDMLDPEKLDQQLKKLNVQMTRTKFAQNYKIVQVSANPTAKEGAEPPKSQGLTELIDTVLSMIELPDRERGSSKPFLFAIDHCFQIKGQGTVITGTVLAGKTKVGDMIELPAYKTEKKIKSMQMFRKPV